MTLRGPASEYSSHDAEAGVRGFLVGPTNAEFREGREAEDFFAGHCDRMQLVRGVGGRYLGHDVRIEVASSRQRDVSGEKL